VWLGNRHQGSHDMNVGRVQRDRRVVTRKSRLLAERDLTELVEPCGALPRKCSFYLFYFRRVISCAAGPRALRWRDLRGSFYYRPIYVGVRTLSPQPQAIPGVG
jgi:hypothetical protein